LAGSPANVAALRRANGYRLLAFVLKCKLLAGGRHAIAVTAPPATTMMTPTTPTTPTTTANATDAAAAAAAADKAAVDRLAYQEIIDHIFALCIRPLTPGDASAPAALRSERAALNILFVPAAVTALIFDDKLWNLVSANARMQLFARLADVCERAGGGGATLADVLRRGSDVRRCLIADFDTDAVGGSGGGGDRMRDCDWTCERMRQLYALPNLLQFLTRSRTHTRTRTRTRGGSGDGGSSNDDAATATADDDTNAAEHAYVALLSRIIRALVVDYCRREDVRFVLSFLSLGCGLGAAHSPSRAAGMGLALWKSQVRLIACLYLCVCFFLMIVCVHFPILFASPERSLSFSTSHTFLFQLATPSFLFPSLTFLHYSTGARRFGHPFRSCCVVRGLLYITFFSN
jgi:hypothetical protein